MATTSPTPVRSSGRERPRHRGADLDRRIRRQIEEEQCEARVRVLDRDRRALGVECQGVKAHRLVPNRGQCRGGIHTDAGGVCLDLVAGVGWTEENGEEGRSRVEPDLGQGGRARKGLGRGGIDVRCKQAAIGNAPDRCECGRNEDRVDVVWVSAVAEAELAVTPVADFLAGL